MRARQHLTRRIASVERLVLTGGEDEYNQPNKEWQEVTKDVPCAFWEMRARGGTQTRDDRSVVVSEIRIMVTSDEDMEAGDRLNQIVDRLGVVLVDGKFRVDRMIARQFYKIAVIERFG